MDAPLFAIAIWGTMLNSDTSMAPRYTPLEWPK